MRLTDRTILITGASSGIGRALALALADENTVIAVARRADRLTELAAEKPRIHAHAANLANSRGREELATWVITEHPELDTLINNAGVSLTSDLTAPVDLQRVSEQIETNLIAPLHLASLLIPHLADRSAPAIINVTSALAFTPMAKVAVYCATKAAMHSLCLSQRHQVKPLGIAVHEIIPPGVDTELGHQDRDHGDTTHGGMPVDEFTEAALAGLARDDTEITVGLATNLYQQRDALFDQLNAER